MKDNAVSIEEFWELIKFLAGDAQRCLKAIDATEDETGKSFWRRMYDRAVFGFIEGATYRMTYHAYMARERPGVTFTPAELERLESAYDFGLDQPKPIFTGKKEFLKDIEFAFEAFARVHEAAYLLPSHDRDFVLVREIAHLRQAF